MQESASGFVRWFRRSSYGFALAALAMVAIGSSGCKKKPPPGGVGGAKEVAPPLTPAERTQPVAIVAPAPLPEGLPLKAHVSPSGKGPKEYVDKPGMRSLLYFKKYAELEAAFETFQHRFETDNFEEGLVFQAAAAFASSEGELKEQLDAWVAASPTSFAPYLARATHLDQAGWDSRGGASASETTSQAFARMKELHTLALVDADKALALRPKLQGPHGIRVRIAKGSAGNKADAKAALDRSLESCPLCFNVRRSYAYGLTPRWGGSYAELDAFAKSAPVDKNPKLAMLAGLADDDRALGFITAKKFDAAIASADAAIAHYDYSDFSSRRADALHRKDDHAAALVAIDHALDLAPGDPESHAERAVILSSLKRWKEAGQELLVTVRVDRTNDLARSYHAHIVQWLVWEGHQAAAAKKRDEALDLLELAVELSPTDQYAAGEHQRAILLDVDPTKDVPRLEAEARDKPDDFRAHQRLDYTYAYSNRFADVVKMWDGYIARHPKDGRARLERGGAHNRMGNRAASHADAKAACDLGVAQGCMFAGRASK